MTQSNTEGYLTIDEFLQLAILFETEAAEYYHRMKGRAHEPDVAALLDSLEDEERQHERVLRKRSFAVDPNTVLRFPPELDLQMPGEKSDDPSFAEMISIAIAREIRAREIYEAAARLASGEFEELLVGLAAYELRHEKKLRSLQ
jgi:rubrerythrin